MRGPAYVFWLGGSAVLAAFVACSSFGSKDDPVSDADASTPEAETADGGAIDARSPDSARRCGSSRAPALRCGANVVCDAGESCCANGVDDRFCLPGNCSGTQMNCQGNTDCPMGLSCCQAGSFIGSQCLTACEPGELRYCYTSDECGEGEGCVPFVDAGYDNVWRCAPCP